MRTALRVGVRVIAPSMFVLAACGDEVVRPQIAPPAIQSITPDHGTVGTEVRIDGAEFSADGVDVLFGNLASPRVEQESGALFAVAPEGLSPGTTYDVHVVNADGGADTLTAAFDAVPPTAARVNGVTRPSGLRGMTVIVEGDAFGDLAEHGGVFFEADDGSPVRAATADVHRAAVGADGTLGDWEALPSLPAPAAYGSLVSFGPYLYSIGGDSATTAADQATVSNAEIAGAYLARVDLRTGLLEEPAWTALAAMNEARSKHSAIFAGGALLVTSGVYAGQPGSSENIHSSVASDGSLDGWNGATGDNTIGALLGYSLYNQAAISFVDAAGTGHVLVLGGAKREAEGEASAAVVYC